jgi:hypothetical protein
MIDIGDYEAQLAGWDSLNILDYQLLIVDTYGPGGSYKENVIVNVKNGIPESCDPPSWLDTHRTTIPEWFSYIKMKETEMKDWPKNRYVSVSFKVNYHSEPYYPVPELYYPISISTRIILDDSPEVNGAFSSSSYSITLTPLGQQGSGEE